MQDNIYERIHKTLSWKKIIAFNVVLFLVLIVPISVRLAQIDTENRSSAANEITPPEIIPPANYPTQPPRIDRVSTFFGKTGDTIVLLGSNYGEYQWESRVFIGNIEAPKDAIVRWSNTVLEVKIPEGARTGQVWIVVNGKQSSWEGSLLLYDVARAAQIGLQKISNSSGKVYYVNAAGARGGMVELSYVSEPFVVVPSSPDIIVTSQEQTSDSLGKKMRIGFEFSLPSTSSRTELFDYSYPGIGAIEILRAELYDESGKLLSIFSDPLAIKVMP
jgi:hypothetical protein